jgi:hypothetical protein
VIEFSPLNVTIMSLGAVAIIYTAAIFGYSLSHRPGMALAFVGYVLANIGLIWDAIQMSAK